MSTIGFITSKKEKLKYYFPSPAEPDLFPIEPPFTPDDQMVVDYLRNKNIEVEPVIWGDEDFPKLKKYKLVIMRSPWDYMDNMENRRRFPLWVKSLLKHKVTVENSVPFMSWLMDKKYLKDILKQGVPIIDTLITNKTEKFNLSELFLQKGPLVIKPCISAAGVGLHFIQNKNEAESMQTTFNELFKKEEHLIQPLIEDIKVHGEWSLIFINGKYSHSIHKLPKQGSILIHTERGGSIHFKDAPEVLLEHASNSYEKIMKAFRQKIDNSNGYQPLYLRCDYIQSGNNFLLSECEGVEPELFFRAKKGSEKVFGDAVLERI